MSNVSPLRICFDAFELDESNARLSCSGQTVPLPPRALAVLCELARRRGKLVTKTDLLDAVWGHQHVSESVLKTVISQLRTALSDHAREPRFIETVSRFGYRFIAETTQESAGGHAATVQPSMIGRTAALERIMASWRRAAGGASQLLCIAGDAGVGKTTLIERFLRDLPPGTAVRGRCLEHFGTGEPHMPLLEILSEMCRRDRSLPPVMREVAPMWLLQMPWLVDKSDLADLQREIAGAHPDRMLRELRVFLERCAGQRPLVLVVEDLHWSDIGTLRTMEDFARQPLPVPVLWVASYRLVQVIAEDHPLRHLRQELKLHGLFEEILLDPFSEYEVEAYLTSRLATAEVSEDFVRRLHSHTGGLPLFVAAVADSLVARGVEDFGPAFGMDGPGGDSLPIPESLAGVVDRQIGRLDRDVQLTLEAASVFGIEFSAGAVAEVLGGDRQQVTEHCDDLVRRQLWLQSASVIEKPDGEFDTQYAFLHALYRHIFYQRIPVSRRVRLHRLAARAIESRAIAADVVAVELAVHYERGHESSAALRAYAAAARNALGRFAPRDAELLATQALSLLHRCANETDRKELELPLASHRGVAASLLHGVGSPEARVAFERVRELCDQLPATPGRALALHGLGWVHYVRGEFDEGLALAMRLETVANDHDVAMLRVLACNLLGVCLIGRGELVEGCGRLETGVTGCQEMGNEVPFAVFVIDPEVSMRMNLVVPLAERGMIDAARMHCDRGIERAGRIGQPIARMLALWAGGMLEVRLRNPERVAEHAGALATLVESAMLSQGAGPALWLRGWAEAQLGQPDAGYRHILEGYEAHARFGMYAGCPEVLGYATEALILQGSWDRAERQLDEAMALAERIGERLAVPRLLELRARIATGRGDVATARAALTAALEEARRQEAFGSEGQICVSLAALPGATAANEPGAVEA